MIRSGMVQSTLTDRGQVSVPVELRKALGLKAGQKLAWAQVSDHEMRVWVQNDAPPGPMAVLGYARKIRDAKPRRTDDWMRELREGE